MSKRHQSVRIIGGEWRGRLLPVLEKEGLRPTKDMVRETLFNWLNAHLPKSSCLDCFAGTGALGLEAASRGASSVVMIEQDRQVAAHLSSLVSSTLEAEEISVVSNSALSYLANKANEAFDIIFIDPPFGLNLWADAITSILENGYLAEHGLLYIESSSKQGLPELPKSLEYIKSKKSGQVVYALAAKV